MIDTVLDGGYRITEVLFEGLFVVARGLAPDGRTVQVTFAERPPPATLIEELTIADPAIPRLRGTVAAVTDYNTQVALIEDEPIGRRVSDLGGPLPLDAVYAIGRDLVAFVARVHDTGAILGSLRPQMTWLAPEAPRFLAATPRPERYGLAGQGSGCVGNVTPFHRDLLFADVQARGEPASVAGDIAQLGMLIYRLATGRSPFVRDDDAGPMAELTRAIQGAGAPWELPSGDLRAAELARIASAAFAPATRSTRSLEPLRRFFG